MKGEKIPKTLVVPPITRPWLHRSKVQISHPNPRMVFVFVAYSCHWEWANIALVVMVKIQLIQLLIGAK